MNAEGKIISVSIEKHQKNFVNFDANFHVMKKTILHSLIIALCFAAIAGCSKDAKVPAAQTTNSAVTKTPQSPTINQNQNTNQNQDHNGGCNHSGSSNGSSDGSYHGG
jgi:hypothetical protein